MNKKFLAFVIVLIILSGVAIAVGRTAKDPKVHFAQANRIVIFINRPDKETREPISKVVEINSPEWVRSFLGKTELTGETEDIKNTPFAAPILLLFFNKNGLIGKMELAPGLGKPALICPHLKYDLIVTKDSMNKLLKMIDEIDESKWEPF